MWSKCVDLPPEATSSLITGPSSRIPATSWSSRSTFSLKTFDIGPQSEGPRTGAGHLLMITRVSFCIALIIGLSNGCFNFLCSFPMAAKLLESLYRWFQHKRITSSTKLFASYHARLTPFLEYDWDIPYYEFVCSYLLYYFILGRL